MKPNDLVPLKVVMDELGVSRVTLWRARRSGIVDFPAPTLIRRLVFWRRSEIQRLEAALLSYGGRVKFERGRDAERKIAAVRRARDAAPRRSRKRGAVEQPSLFEP